MNVTSAAPITALPKAGSRLFETIFAIKASVGDGLTDEELSRLLDKTKLPAEAGFEFLAYVDRFVTLSVPAQELANWYPDQGWISAEKEKIIRAIAEKHQFTLCEPPDAISPGREWPNPHHHLELCNGREAVAVFHPLYAKVRLFLPPPPGMSGRRLQTPLNLGPDFLPDVSALYKD